MNEEEHKEEGLNDIGKRYEEVGRSIRRKSLNGIGRSMRTSLSLRRSIGTSVERHR